MKVVPHNNEDEKNSKLNKLAKELRPIMLAPIRQSVSKLSKDVTSLSNLINEKDSHLSKKINNLEIKYKESVNVARLKEISKLDDELASIEKSLNQRLNLLAMSVESVKKENAEKHIVKEIVKPEVKQITVHKDHDKDIKELQKQIDLIDKKEIVSEKVVEVRHSSRAQNKLNLILAVGLAVSLILHVL